MKDAHFIHDLDHLISMYAEACDWLSSLGFDYSKNRYGIYEKVFARFTKMTQTKELEDDLIGFKNSFDNAYIQVNEIVRVHNNLKAVNPIEFNEQIKKVCSGQEFRGVSVNDQARDFLFELSVASRFINAGFHVSLTGICDVVVGLNGGESLFVECKRIRSERQIAKNISKAAKQLVKRMSSQTSSKVNGLIAVNITDILPDTRMLYPETVNAVSQIHRMTSNKFVSDRLKDFSVETSKKCFGVMCESATMQYLNKESNITGFTYSRHTEFLPYSNSEVFKELAPKISSQDVT
ncbi:MAG: hypothetical protein ACI83B_003026 [Sediminicola sp.]|jgi:hypothetical protein